MPLVSLTDQESGYLYLLEIAKGLDMTLVELLKNNQGLNFLRNRQTFYLESRFAAFQVIKILSEQDQGKSVSKIGRTHQIGQLAFTV